MALATTHRMLFLLWDLCPLLSGLRQANRNRLFSALHFSTFAGLTRFERSFFLSVYCTLNSFSGAFAVFMSGALFSWHHISLVN